MAFLTNDRQVYHGVVHSNSFYPEQILLAVRLKICLLRPKFDKLRKTIRTYKMLVMTQICLNKQIFRWCGKARPRNLQRSKREILRNFHFANEKLCRIDFFRFEMVENSTRFLLNWNFLFEQETTNMEK